ncbi:unnamed protein product [Sordaria macrospora k-hell]|uniref:WGS project CABT00000000 data, contig 2.14 n=1 Tax=Sordaria macrospora (strain ATCC MYA-333 / DSM 997 / K(L3346) / K-hell) TaxID=771870 RepID=F7VZ74_SORMK|nr:uncharacterized protein SMAC_07838 [Sordaria macrospora k-hell]CCC10821.1 unnamed protein product [Sordaria macrospora k-hell]
MQTPKSKLRGRTVGGTCIRNQQSLCRTSFDTSQNINEYNQTKSSKRKATTPNRFFSNTSNINTTEMSTQSKADKIEEVRKNLPSPSSPPSHPTGNPPTSATSTSAAAASPATFPTAQVSPRVSVSPRLPTAQTLTCPTLARARRITSLRKDDKQEYRDTGMGGIAAMFAA